MSNEEAAMYAIVGYGLFSIVVCIGVVAWHDIVKYNLFSNVRAWFRNS
jgi:hypothetical protein